jgi:ATP-dependent DNA helicase DinG
VSDYLEQAFGRGGWLAAHLTGYEPRTGQLTLARAIDAAMTERGHLLGEGPCGVGKVFAYGVPAVYHATQRGKRVVIATANIALEEQLVKRDLPLLQRVLPWPFSFALLKGRNNFLCLDRHEESVARGELLRRAGDEHDRQVRAIDAWAGRTTTGDVSELPFVPKPQLWSKFAVGADECKGKDCPQHRQCFSERAKAAAHKAHITVTNYHLLFAHLALRRQAGVDLVLPPFDLLILDEGHEAAEIAREFFGFSVSERTLQLLAGYAEKKFGQPKLARALREHARAFFERVVAVAHSPDYRRRLRAAGFADSSDLGSDLTALAGHAGARANDGRLDKEARKTASNVHRLAHAVRDHLDEALALRDPNKVYWIEHGADERARLRAKTIDVSALLREEVFGHTPTVVVSATLTTAGGFDFIRRELGAPESAKELIVPSPFDFARQALIVLPDGLPDPRDAGFIGAAGAAFEEVVEQCGGRTLGLFTSYKNLNAIYARITACGYRVLRQGDQPRTELARLFREDVTSVLLGTDSFWTGIDVPGEALTGLVLDKLPFPNPVEPVVDALCARDKDAFFNFMIPQAILKFRQGIGRLIRSQSDVGVIVVLDPRIRTKPYGKLFMRSLPPAMRWTKRLDIIDGFLRLAGGAPAMAPSAAPCGARP